MDRRKRTLIVVAIAVVAATLASFAVYRAIERIPVREVEVAHTYIVVAAKPMEMGTLLTKDDIRLVAWPSRNPVPGCFGRVEPVMNRGLIQAVAENEPITETKLAPLGAGAGLPPAITPGMRAISVRVNEVIGVAGFTVPGTHVDVVVTAHPQQQQDQMSRVVVTNVQVLAAGTRIDQDKATKDGTPIPTTVVTLLVTPIDAEKIALAQNEGSITLALRNPLDTAPTVTAGIRSASLMGVAAPPPEIKSTKGVRRAVIAPPPPPPPPPSKPYVVEAIRAAKRTEEPIR